jgi:splicing factor 45
MECSKYGSVQSVLIFEVLEPGFDPEEAVRIFVRFGRVEDATKAVVDLNGRFFGGRTVSAGFFDENRFDKQDLAPKTKD